MATGLGAALITEIPNTTAKSSDINSNNNALNTAATPTFNKVNLATGSITRVSTFTGSGNGTFNHNLGTTPAIVLFVSTQSGVPQSFEYHSATSTQVTVTASGSSQTWIAFAIAFT